MGEGSGYGLGKQGLFAGRFNTFLRFHSSIPGGPWMSDDYQRFGGSRGNPFNPLVIHRYRVFSNYSFV